MTNFADLLNSNELSELKQLSNIKEEEGAKKQMAQTVKSNLHNTSLDKPFEIGEIVILQVTGIQPFGVFGTVKKFIDGKEYTGLVHKTIVKENETIEDLNQHFKLGDYVKGTVEGYDRTGKMSVSTIPFYNELPNYSEEEKTKALEIEKALNKEMEQLYEFLMPIIVELTDDARVDFESLVREFGLVKVIMTATRIAPTFYVDLGKMLAIKIRESLKECL